MKSFVALLSLLFCAVSLTSQDVELTWGEIPSADLAMNEYELDPDAGAVVLADIGNLKFVSAGQYQIEHHRRIKILDRSGFSEGDISIKFYSSSDTDVEDISLEAQVFSPDGSKIVLTENDFYLERGKDDRCAFKFSIPQLEEGSVFEYRYTLYSSDLLSLDTWYFQGSLPIRWSEFLAEIPEWYSYFVLKSGGLDIEESSIGNLRIRGSLGGSNVRTNKTRYVKKDVPALEREAFITTMSDYYAKVEFQLRSVSSAYMITENICNDWNALWEELRDDLKFGRQFTKTRNYDDAIPAVDQALRGIFDPQEKVVAIYDMLAERMEWDGRYRILVGEGQLNDVFEVGEGSSGELNLLLLALLKEKGFDAFPLLVSTRSHGAMIELYPFVSQFNHVFVGVMIEDEAILLDLSEENSPAGLPAIQALNGRALAIYEGIPQWIDIPTPFSKSIYYAVSSLSYDGTISGVMKTSFDGYGAVICRNELEEETSSEIWSNIFANTYPESEVLQAAVSGVEDSNEKVTEEIHFELQGAAQVAGNYIYLNPVFYTGHSENPFSEEERLYPVDIPFPTSNQFIFSYEIPEGYEVEEMPEPIRAVMEGGAGLFQYTITDRGGSIQVRVEVELYKLRYEPEEYHVIKNFFDLMLEKMSEPVVLVKTEIAGK